MKERMISVPELVLLAGTRVALGAGIGLLVSQKMNRDQKKGAGWALVGLGVATTIPLLFEIGGKDRSQRSMLAA